MLRRGGAEPEGDRIPDREDNDNGRDRKWKSQSMSRKNASILRATHPIVRCDCVTVIDRIEQQRRNYILYGETADELQVLTAKSVPP